MTHYMTAGMSYIEDPDHGETLSELNGMYPTEVTCLRRADVIKPFFGTTYLVVVHGAAVVETLGMPKVHVEPGSFVVVPGGYVGLTDAVDSDEAFQAVAIKRYGFNALPAAGALEDRGRLSYIDGCSTTILAPPPRRGDAVLNHLHFPEHVVQTQHTHPSLRAGVVIGGSGVAWKGRNGLRADMEAALAGSEAELEWHHELRTGGMFLLHSGELHSFCTKNSRMDIVAFHPDSDTGPTDEDHPMLNRTHLRGESSR